VIGAGWKPEIIIGVREVPPFLLAAMRSLVAGLVLFGWMIAGVSPPPVGANGRPAPIDRAEAVALIVAALGLRTILGTLLVLISVAVITTMRAGSRD
jgi:hypothetical protein